MIAVLHVGSGFHSNGLSGHDLSEEIIPLGQSMAAVIAPVDTH
jgi:hypothetical protein